jgi:predicted hotdog family 3-hydroxylacyl-ACP dehydratase
VTIEIVDGGEVIRTMTRDATAGVNRTTWGLRKKGVRFPTTSKEEAEQRDRQPVGPEVMPGTYTVRYSYGDHVDSTTVTVKPDPRVDGMRAAQEEKMALYDRLMRMTETATAAADRLREAKRTTSRIDDLLGDRDDEAATAAMEKGQAMRDSIQTIMEDIEGKDVQGIRRDPSIVTARLGAAQYYLGSSVRGPDQSDRRALQRAEARLQRLVDEVNQFFDAEWPAYRQSVTDANITFFDDHEPIQMSSDAE